MIVDKALSTQSDKNCPYLFLPQKEPFKTSFFELFIIPIIAGASTKKTNVVEIKRIKTK